jgi:hypothetical protein
MAISSLSWLMSFLMEFGGFSEAVFDFREGGWVDAGGEETAVGEGGDHAVPF